MVEYKIDDKIFKLDDILLQEMLNIYQSNITSKNNNFSIFITDSKELQSIIVNILKGKMNELDVYDALCYPYNNVYELEDLINSKCTCVINYYEYYKNIYTYHNYECDYFNSSIYPNTKDFYKQLFNYIEYCLNTKNKYCHIHITESEEYYNNIFSYYDFCQLKLLRFDFNTCFLDNNHISLSDYLIDNNKSLIKEKK